MGLQLFYGKGLRPLLWAGAQAISGKNINKWCTKLPILLGNFYSIYRIYKCVRGLQVGDPQLSPKKDLWNVNEFHSILCYVQP